MKLLTAVLLLILLESAAAFEQAPKPDWNAWSADVFEQAGREGKLVLVDLVADWCAFCKKMDATTYRDPQVLAVMEKDFVAVRADPEKQPELPQRFMQYARPSTVILAADGTEIMKKQGYLQPQWMLWTLQAVAAKPDADHQ